MPTTLTQLALAAAAGLHLAAFPDHRDEGAAVATFFLVVALLQLGAATLVKTGMDRRLRLAIVAGNLGLIGLWVMSRTIGLLGSEPEAAGVLDVLAVAAEAAVVVGGILIGRSVTRAPARAGRLLPAVALTAVLTCGAAVLWAPGSHSHDYSHDDGVSSSASTGTEVVPHRHASHTHGPPR